MLSNLHKFHYKSFDHLGFYIGLRIKKLWLEWCFCTVWQIYLCHCVTWKVWQNHGRNWFLDGVLQLCQQCYTDMRQPKIYFVQDLKFTSGQTGKIPFEILQNVTVWHFASLSECSLFWTQCWCEAFFTCIYLYQSQMSERDYLQHFTWLVPSSRNLNSKKGASINVTLYGFWVIQGFRAKKLFLWPNPLYWSGFMLGITYFDGIVQILSLIVRKNLRNLIF